MERIRNIYVVLRVQVQSRGRVLSLSFENPVKTRMYSSRMGPTTAVATTRCQYQGMYDVTSCLVPCSFQEVYDVTSCLVSCSFQEVGSVSRGGLAPPMDRQMLLKTLPSLAVSNKYGPVTRSDPWLSHRWLHWVWVMSSTLYPSSQPTFPCLGLKWKYFFLSR